MANSNANQIQINLQEGLNLNTNKAEITPFAGFRERNSPFYNGGVSPMFKSEIDGEIIDKSGNVYKCENGNFTKNGTVLANNIPQYEFVKQEFDIGDYVCWGMDEWGNFITASGMSFTYSGVTVATQYPVINIVYEGIDKRFIVFCFSGRNYEAFIVSTRETESASSPVYDRATGTINESYSDKVKAVNIVNVNTFNVIDFLLAEKGSPITEITHPMLVWGDFGTKIVYTRYYAYEGDVLLSPPAKNASPDSSYFYGAAVISVTGSWLEPVIITPIGGVYDGDIPYVGTKVGSSDVVISDGFITYCNNVWIHSSGKDVTLSASNMSWSPVNTGDNESLFADGRLVVGAGCDGKNSDGTYDSISINGIYNHSSGFGLLYNSNKISGISYNNTLLTPWLSVDVSGKYSVQFLTYKGMPSVFYKDAITKKGVLISVKATTRNKLSIINDNYVFINTTGFYNGFNIETSKFLKMFGDFNNRACVGVVGSSVNGAVGTVEVAGGHNVNYEILNDPNVGAIFNPSVKHCAMYVQSDSEKKFVRAISPFPSTLPAMASTEPYYIDLFFSNDVKTPSYKTSVVNQIQLTGGVPALVKREDLKGVLFPMSTDGNPILSASALAAFFDSGIGADFIKDGRYFNLIYYEGFPLLAYYYGSGVANAESRFVIQGQSFVIRKGLIYSTSYQNGLMYIGEAIVNVDDLKFIGALPMAAFFFSPATKCVLAFTGDRNLKTAFEATEMVDVLKYKYIPNDNSLYLATANAVYVLFNTPDGTSFVYKIAEQNVTDFMAQDNGCVAMKVGNKWKVFSLYPREGMTRVPVRLSTDFYGAGQNRVSTIDCWYIRLFADAPVSGSVKLKVETITNRSVTSEEQTFYIKEEDWDENNLFVYLRYQPKLQRSVGCSLTIESDFAIYDIQTGLTTDSTVQLTESKGF